MEEDNLGVGRMEAINRGNDPGDDLGDLDLPRLLSDQLLVEQSALLTRLTPLLEPNELQLMGLAQPLLQLRGATAALERQRSLKRCRHLLDAWSSQRLETLERCIALLLEEERREAVASASGLAPVSDMESRIDSLFTDLNGDALRFQDLYYNERRYLTELDSRRCAGYEEVVQQENSDVLTA